MTNGNTDDRPLMSRRRLIGSLASTLLLGAAAPANAGTLALSLTGTATGFGPVSWAIEIGAGGSDSVSAAARSPDGGTVVVINGTHLIKILDDRSIAWIKVIQDPATTLHTLTVNAIGFRSDGGMYLAGSCGSTSGSGSREGFISCFRADGTHHWSRWMVDAMVSQIMVEPNDDVIVLTTAWNGTYADTRMMRFVSNGSSHSSTLIAKTSQTSAHSLKSKKLPDGSFLLFGNTYSFGAANNDAFLARMTSAGALSWARGVRSSGNDGFYDAIITSSGDIMAVGHTNGYPLIGRYSSTGTPVDVLTSTSAGSINAIDETESGKFLCAVNTSSIRRVYGFNETIKAWTWGRQGDVSFMNLLPAPINRIAIGTRSANPAWGTRTTVLGSMTNTGLIANLTTELATLPTLTPVSPSMLVNFSTGNQSTTATVSTFTMPPPVDDMGALNVSEVS